MRRRAFTALLGGAVAAWPLAARAQQPPVPVIGALGSGSAAGHLPMVAAFREGLKETGYIEGQNVAIEYRWAEGQYDQLPALAADLVRHQVAVIVVLGGAAGALAAKAATRTIPIVFVIGADPVKSGLVVSLKQPGGNITGVYLLGTPLELKRLELLHQLVPHAKLIGMLINPTYPDAEVQVRGVQTAARSLGLKVQVVNASSERDFETAFATLIESRVDAMIVAVDAFFLGQRDQLVALAGRHSIPAMYGHGEFAAAGGLVSYGTTITDAFRQVGTYAGRILKGDKPANLPVQQSTRVELVINLKTAKTLGLTIPPSVLARADEVIE